LRQLYCTLCVSHGTELCLYRICSDIIVYIVLKHVSMRLPIGNVHSFRSNVLVVECLVFESILDCNNFEVSNKKTEIFFNFLLFRDRRY